MIFALPTLFVICRWLWPLPLPLWLTVAMAASIAVSSQFHLLSRLSSGSMFAPELPRWSILAMTWVLAATLFLFFLQLGLDLVTLAAALGGYHLPVTELRAGIGLFAGALAGWGVFAAARQPHVTDIDVRIRHLPPAFDGYRLLQLSDLHLSRLFPAAWAEKMVARANTLGADAIVISGDLIDGSLAARAADILPLQKLSAPDGVYMIPGNHEYFFDYHAWMRRFFDLGLDVLENAHRLLKRDGDQIVLAGVTDLSAVAFGCPPSDLETALAGAPGSAPIILLNHQPRTARVAAARGVALQLSGHTHGGMIVGLDRLVARGNNGFVSGAYRIDDMTLYVSNGTALWPGFAIRIGCPAEMTRFTLRPAG